MEATKRCPFCAEEILAAARKCKHCGSDLGWVPERPPPEPQKRSAFSKLLRAIGVIILGLFIIGIYKGIYDNATGTNTGEATASPTPYGISAFADYSAVAGEGNIHTHELAFGIRIQRLAN